MEATNSSTLYVFKYIFNFVTRAFLIAILCLILLFMIVFFLYFGDLIINLKNDNVKNPLFGTYIIVSESMIPTIKINDAIIIKREDSDKYNIGDIITFSSNDINYKGLTITHRIVDKESINSENSIYTTKGDNNSIVDPSTVKTDNIYGKVLFKIPKVGYIQSFFSKPTNFFLCLLVPTVIFVFYDLFRIMFMMKNENEV